MSQPGIGRYLRTVVHLRPGQIFRRARCEFERRLGLGAPARWTASSPPRMATDFPALPLPSPADCSTESLRAGVFTHLNESRTIGFYRPDWQLGAVTKGRLWTVTLHYHRWALQLAQLAASDSPHAAEALSLFQHFVREWIERCPFSDPRARPLAWNAFAVATRISHWTRACRLLGPERLGSPDFTAAFLKSLWEQAEFLCRHVEWDLRANHLLRDAVGLACAGRFFAEPQAARWLRCAASITAAQVKEQILADGGHFERSPMYHAQIMEDLRTLRSLLADPALQASMDDALQRMTDWLAWMSHPDGRFALLNDGAWNGVDVPPPAANSGGRHLADSGIVAWHGRRWTVFFDVGELGPVYQPGHGHADTLSVECSVDGHRLFVDPGTYHYDSDKRRAYDRSTAAHNTVVVDGQDSSEVWDIFRVGRRAHVRNAEAKFGSDFFEACGTHNGYRHLSDRPTHTRRLRLSPGNQLLIEDFIGGAGTHSLSGGLLLDPAWSAQGVENGWRLAGLGISLVVTVTADANIRLRTESRTVHPEFGAELPTLRLSWSADAALLPARVTTNVELL